jgi:hypothetical protein
VILIGVLFQMTVKPASSSAAFAALATLALAATIAFAMLRQSRRPALP